MGTRHDTISNLGELTVRKPGIDAPTFLLHWSLVLALILSLLTGFRIASDYMGSVAGVLARRIQWMLPQGRVIELHVLSGWIVTIIAIGYMIFIWRSRQTTRVKFSLVDYRTLSKAPHRRPFRANTPAWFAINRLVFQLAFGLIGVLAVTGWMMYHDMSSGLGFERVMVVHGVAAWLIIAYSAIHVAAVFKVGTFGRIFRPRSVHVAAGIGALFLAGAIVGGAYLADRASYTTLMVPMVAEVPALDGTGTDSAWDKADLVEVNTVRGANLPGGESMVQIRAVHDGESIYFLFRWEDPQRSQKMTPLIKTASGWRVLQTGLERNDENEYYEDKFAAIISRRPTLASGTAHLGQDLIEGPHYRNPRGLHFTTDGEIVDLWHWKSVRSGDMTPGYIDDNYIGPPRPSEEPEARYTGGYTQDPPGPPHPYIQNWVKVNPDLTLDETSVLPRYLPADPSALERMGTVDLDPAAHDDGIWSMSIDEVVPYDPELDDYPIGSVIPGIVIEGPFQGDRADVRAEAMWADGHWTLEATRVLDTGSDYDVPFSQDQAVFLWVAVFNHTQTRHSYHIHPVRVVLQ